MCIKRQLEVLRGAYDAFLGKEIDYSALAPTPQAVNATKVETEGTVDIKFGYCTEFIILLDKEFTEKDEIEFKAYLESIGDSIVCVADEDVVKIHVHTNDPGLAIQKALTYGQLSRCLLYTSSVHSHRIVTFYEVRFPSAALEEVFHFLMRNT